MSYQVNFTIVLFLELRKKVMITDLYFPFVSYKIIIYEL